MLVLLKFFLPFIIWIFVLRDFVFGFIPVNMDTQTIYGVAKYYFNNLLNGVVPLWEPFVVLGRPFYALSICNLFNPATQLIAILKLLGVHYYAGFLAYIVFYFAIGLAGFYLLAKTIYKDRLYASWAYVLLLFSGLGVSLFTQLTWVEIFVPTVWFFYFFLQFSSRPSRGNFLGLIFSLMLALSSYLPFYFLTLVGVCSIVGSMIYFSKVKVFFKNSIGFIGKNKIVTFLGLAGLLIAALPLGAYKAIDASGDSVSPGRHCQYSSVQECYDRTMNQKGGMIYEEAVRSGTLGERIDLGSLFAHLDKLTYGSDSPIFIPVFVFLLMGLGIFLRLTKQSIFFLTVGSLIALIALGGATPHHRFLYDHVFFFQYFRNIFFFIAFLIPLTILLAVGQMKALLELKLDTVTRRKVVITGTIATHVLFFIFLSRYNGVPSGSFVTVILSAGLFVMHYAGVRLSTWMWGGLFAIVMSIQPIQILTSYAAHAAEFKCVLPHDHVRPVFGWIRPDQPQTSECKIYQFVPYEDFWYAMSMTDAPAKVGYPQSVSRGAFDLSQKVDAQTLAQYGRYKIVLYDDPQKLGLPVLGESPLLKVKHFDVNQLELETNLERRMFLVYNDAFTSAWKVFIDGKPDKIVLANHAFKGVWVEAGPHTVLFRYSPLGGQWLYIFVTAVLMIFLIMTLWTLKKENP